MTMNHTPNHIPPDLHSALDYSGRVAVITGASRGIGAGIAARFAEGGAAVVINCRTDDVNAQAVAAKIRHAGGTAHVVLADVSTVAGATTLMKEASRLCGRVDVLVNNAGSYPVSPLVDMDPAEWDAVLRGNLRSAFLCTQAAARLMIEQGAGGAIVNISSIEAVRATRFHAHYAAAKAGLEMLTKTGALELGPHGIRVNGVAPGLIWRHGLQEDWPEGVERWLENAPLGRLGRPEDVADACLFLASPLARWITGAILAVDGGILATPAF